MRTLKQCGRDMCAQQAAKQGEGIRGGTRGSGGVEVWRRKEAGGDTNDQVGRSSCSLKLRQQLELLCGARHAEAS